MSLKFKDANEFKEMWRNSGLYQIKDENDAIVDVNRISMADALTYPDAPYFFQQTMEFFLREAIEPVLVGARLLQRVTYKAGTIMTYGSVGAMYAADIEEGSEYPERTLNFGKGFRTATIGKSGLAVAFTEEMKRYNQFDMVGLHVRAAGKALARHKEKKIMNMFANSGTITHDNVTPANSVFGISTGRRLNGDANGTITAEDIMDAYGQMLINGFTPDVLLVHPLTFIMFQNDPVLRAMTLASGSGSWLSGQPGIQLTNPWTNGSMGSLGPHVAGGSNHPNARAAASVAFNAYNQNIGGIQLPGYFGQPLTVIVSPFVAYNPTTRLTNLHLIDSSEAGLLIVDEEPMMEQIDDKLRDVSKIKFRERYAIAQLNEGKAVCTLKNIKVAKNELITPVQGVAAEITSLSNSTAVLNSNGEIQAGNGIPGA